jgi:hypothetical protein
VCSTSVTKIEHPFIGGTFRIEGAGRGRALEEKNFPHPCAVHRRALFICSGDHPHAGVAQPHILCARWTDPSNRFTAPFGITCNGDRALRLRTRAGAAILKSLRHRGRHPRSTDPSPRQAVLFGTQGRAQPRDRRAARHPRTTAARWRDRAIAYGIDDALAQLEAWELLRTARPRGCEGNATQQCVGIGNT